MNRREIIKQITLLTGGAVVGAELFLSGCKAGGKTDAGFSKDILALLDEIGETIIPATTTPGAKAAQIGNFMKIWVTDCYTQAEQEVFMKGITTLQEQCKRKYSKSFVECEATQRHDLLVSLEKEAKEFNNKKYEGEKPQQDAAKNEGKEFTAAPPHYYTMLKQMTLHGFFTSKTGATETLRYVAVPGKYDGDYPYKKGDRAWAT
jgi:hypothetical protein